LDRPRQDRLDPVEGQPPDLTRLDGGCAFRPRCRFAVAACAEASPALTAVGELGHSAACFRAADIASEIGRAA
jgi:oligopeptide/dipeptide ABC transporter ATP-binding protein